MGVVGSRRPERPAADRRSSSGVPADQPSTSYEELPSTAACWWPVMRWRPRTPACGRERGVEASAGDDLETGMPDVQGEHRRRRTQGRAVVPAAGAVQRSQAGRQKGRRKGAGLEPPVTPNSMTPARPSVDRAAAAVPTWVRPPTPVPRGRRCGTSRRSPWSKVKWVLPCRRRGCCRKTTTASCRPRRRRQFRHGELRPGRQRCRRPAGLGGQRRSSDRDADGGAAGRPGIGRVRWAGPRATGGLAERLRTAGFHHRAWATR